MSVDRKLVLENCKITFRNFSGEASKYNRAGDRNFHVILAPELAEELEEEGWNVKWFTPKDPDEVPNGHMLVSVAFGNYPPNIFMISGKKKTKLDEDTISCLDHAEIENIDLVIRPYNWDLGDGRCGVKAYVQSMYVTIVQDAFAYKYEEFDVGPEDEEVPW